MVLKGSLQLVFARWIEEELADGEKK